MQQKKNQLRFAETALRGDLLDDLPRERQADAAGRDRRPGTSRPSGRSRRCTAGAFSFCSASVRLATGSDARSTPGIVITCAPLSSASFSPCV